MGRLKKFIYKGILKLLIFLLRIIIIIITIHLNFIIFIIEKNLCLDIQKKILNFFLIIKN